FSDAKSRFCSTPKHANYYTEALEVLRMALLHQHKLALKRREELAAALGNQHVFLQADVTGLCGNTQLQGEYITRLHQSRRHLSITRPARAEHGAAVVHGAAQPVTEAMLELRVSRVDDHLASCGIDFEPAYPWFQHRGARFDRADDRRKRCLRAGRRR